MLSSIEILKSTSQVHNTVYLTRKRLGVLSYILWFCLENLNNLNFGGFSIREIRLYYKSLKVLSCFEISVFFYNYSKGPVFCLRPTPYLFYFLFELDQILDSLVFLSDRLFASAATAAVRSTRKIRTKCWDNAICPVSLDSFYREWT